MYDAIIIGSGPNGLAAAIRLAQQGYQTKVVEGAETPGGGMRTLELTEPGVKHDICSAIHPLGIGSPFFSTLPLDEHGLRWIHPPLSLAHPLASGSVAWLSDSLEETAAQFGADARLYKRLFSPLVDNWQPLIQTIFSYPPLPSQPLIMARFGWYAIRSAQNICKRVLSDPKAATLFAGIAAHSVLPLEKMTSAAIGFVLGAMAHTKGWVFPAGGSQSLANALVSYYKSLGGELETGRWVTDMDELEPAQTYLFDTAPQKLISIAENRLDAKYVRRLKKFKYGAGIFKIDALLSEPVPWQNEACKQAATIHLGGNYDEIAESERKIHQGRENGRPYVLIAQQSLFDPSRTSDNRHTLWAYCHVPHGSTQDMTRAIFDQIERYAPGFRDTVLQTRTHHSLQMEDYNPNYIGGDINGGMQDATQIFTRPVTRLYPYQTSNPEIFLCSSSTPPGGGVHGMCGFNAAKCVSAFLQKKGV